MTQGGETVSRWVHYPETVGSTPTPATMERIEYGGRNCGKTHAKQVKLLTEIGDATVQAKRAVMYRFPRLTGRQITELLTLEVTPPVFDAINAHKLENGFYTYIYGEPQRFTGVRFYVVNHSLMPPCGWRIINPLEQSNDPL